MEPNIETVLNEFNNLPRFPDGRIDYTHSQKAPILICLVEYNKQILLLKRSSMVKHYRRLWGLVSGYIDKKMSMSDILLEELNKELDDVHKSDIISMRWGSPYVYNDTKINKVWTRYPVHIDLRRKPNIKLNWENSEYRWVNTFELSKYDALTPCLKNSFKEMISKL